MSTFVFKAVDVAGVPARGEVEASDRKAVTDQLRQRGLIPLEVAEKTKSAGIELRRRRVKSSDLTVATRQLATMISSGMTILRTLHVLEEQTQSKPLKETLVTVRRDVEAGLAFSDALSRHPKIFSSLYVAMVRAGEAGGVLEESLLRIADQLEKDESLRRQVRAAMVYPSVVSGFALTVLIGLVAFIVPVFVKVFAQFNSELPAVTQLTVGISNFVTGRWYLLIAAVAAAVFGFRHWKASERGRRQWDQVKLKAPFKIGPVVQKVALARWSRTFSALISAGVPILQAIEITGKTAGNSVVEEAMARVVESVKRGGTIAAPLRESSVFPAMVAHMVGVGEETGALDTMLSKVADFYEDEVAAAVKALTSILEPIMIVGVGAVVGFIVIAMYMPLFRVYDSIR